MGTPLELVKGIWRDNCVVPLFWQHGEEHAVLLEELDAMYASGIRGFIAEARPFAGYLEPPWWQTLEFLCAQAKRLNMSVWVFDDGHFPSGFAGGLVQAKRPDLTRLLVRCAIGEATLKEGEEVLARVALSPDGANRVLPADEGCPSEGQLATLILTREGGERHTAPYINFLSTEAVEFYLDTIYRPHYEHLRRYAGNVFQGFFSDEPRFGNAPSYLTRLGQPEVHLPWEQSMPEEISALLGHDCLAELPLLWTNGAPCAQRAIRQAYMEAVTRRFGELFSARVGEWCQEHGLKHIGHVIEDNGAHVRLGYGPGHYFRSQKGQHWAGVDTVLLQQGPGRTDGWTKTAFGDYDNRFYHWGLAKLASSCAKLEPTMQGSFVEIFGAYGWHAGLPFQKWLVDHFAVRGVNHFVPHAFSPAAFPDLDCPPHFYARGQNPQWRLFPWLVAYMQRMGNLLADGQSVASIGLLYHAESEWSGEPCEPFESLAPALARHQLDFDVIDLDHLAEATMKDGAYAINGHSYRLLAIPATASVTPRLATVLEKLLDARVAVVFAGQLPDGLSEHAARRCQCITAEELPALACQLGLTDFRCTPSAPALRVLHWQSPDGDRYLCLNESVSEAIDTDYETPIQRPGSLYFPADNTLWRAEGRLSLAPGQAVVLWMPHQNLPNLPSLGMIERQQPIAGEWRVAIRSVGGVWQELGGCWKAGLSLDASPEMQRFSGDVRFRLEFTLTRPDAPRLLVGLTAFVGAASWSLNGVALPPLCGTPYQAEVTDCLKDGLNTLEIIQATTPHRLYPDSVFDRDFAPEPLRVPGLELLTII
ncbi:MAG: hypothetical protein IJJ33_10605 [Victivallales bacterium]|nr:hypothetical protein [Victivallales bacterium]